MCYWQLRSYSLKLVDSLRECLILDCLVYWLHKLDFVCLTHMVAKEGKIGLYLLRNKVWGKFIGYDVYRTKWNSKINLLSERCVVPSVAWSTNVDRQRSLAKRRSNRLARRRKEFGGRQLQSVWSRCKSTIFTAVYCSWVLVQDSLVCKGKMCRTWFESGRQVSPVQWGSEIRMCPDFE